MDKPERNTMPRHLAFDEDYYRRYYVDPRTRVETVGETRSRMNFVCGYIKYLGQDIKAVLDLGCGLGQWQSVITTEFPRASYTGVERSEYLCNRFGWRQGSVVSFRSRRRYDLLICYDVLQYLDDHAATQAIDNLQRLCRGILYFGVLTKEDWTDNCDQARTDGKAHLRRANWYRSRLRDGFTNMGGGLFLSDDSPIVVYDMEQLR